MVVGVGVFAQLMQYLLSSYQPLVWAFFSGVILMSAGVIGRQLPAKFLVIYTPLGTVLGACPCFGCLRQPVSQMHCTFFWGGAVAVCAWLLPAISGSYVLLALGLYAPVIDALAGLNYEVFSELGYGVRCGADVVCTAPRLAAQALQRAIAELVNRFYAGFTVQIMAMAGSATERRVVWASVAF